MKTIVPSYYNKFHCTASGCKHNCCREGWEIFIDDAHTDLYRKIAAEEKNAEESILKGLFLPSARERKSGLRPEIRLSEDGVCPFLENSGLCRLIKTYGEASVCQICSDHPRFRNYPKGCCETGIGLCCEEACRIILSDQDTGIYVNAATGIKEEPFHRKLHLHNQMRTLMKLELDFPAWTEYLLGLDILEDAWAETLKLSIRQNRERAKESDKENSRCFLNLEEYFLFRYGVTGQVEFASFSLRFIRYLAEVLGCSGDTYRQAELAELCRMYSSEIEYSEENRRAVTDKLRKEGYRIRTHL